LPSTVPAQSMLEFDAWIMSKSDIAGYEVKQ
jgi:hypothetical protein